MRHLMHKQMLWISSPSFSICASFCYWVSLCFVTERNLNSCFNLAFSSSVLCLSRSIQDLLQKFKTAWICNEVCTSVCIWVLLTVIQICIKCLFFIFTHRLCYTKKREYYLFPFHKVTDGWFALTCPTFDLWKNDMHAHTRSWCRNVSASHLTPFLFVCVFVCVCPFLRSNQKQPKGNVPRGRWAHKPQTGVPKWDCPFKRGCQRQSHNPPKAHFRRSSQHQGDSGYAAARYGQEEGGLSGASEAKIPPPCFGDHGSPGKAEGTGQ